LTPAAGLSLGQDFSFFRNKPDNLSVKGGNAKRLFLRKDIGVPKDGGMGVPPLNCKDLGEF
jgi:hypothetical protein